MKKVEGVADYPACKQGLVKPYCSVTVFHGLLLLWLATLPAIQSEKQISNEVKKIAAVVLNYYDSLDKFLEDPNFSSRQVIALRLNKNKLDSLKEDKPATTLRSDRELIQIVNIPEGKPFPLPLGHDLFLHEFYKRSIDSSYYESLKARFEEFEKNVLGKSEYEAEKEIIYEQILKPERLLEEIPRDSILSLNFLKEKIFKSPQIICSLIGFALGLAYPIKDWLFDLKNMPVPLILSALSAVGAMFSPMAQILLGVYVTQSMVISKDMFLKLWHIIFMAVVKCAAIPLLGLLWILIVQRNLDEELYIKNPVLMFINYTFWIVPNPIISIMAYILADHFTKEYVVLVIYSNIVSIPMMAVNLIIYFYLRGD